MRSGSPKPANVMLDLRIAISAKSRKYIQLVRTPVTVPNMLPKKTTDVRFIILASEKGQSEKWTSLIIGCFPRLAGTVTLETKRQTFCSLSYLIPATVCVVNISVPFSCPNAYRLGSRQKGVFFFGDQSHGVAFEILGKPSSMQLRPTCHTFQFVYQKLLCGEPLSRPRQESVNPGPPHPPPYKVPFFFFGEQGQQ